MSNDGKVEAASRRFIILSAHPPTAPPNSTSCPTNRYLDRAADIGLLTGNLPHWRQQGATYYITFRLGDSLPRALVDRVKEEKSRWLQANPEPHSLTQKQELFRFFEILDEYLDAGHGVCLLSDPRAQVIVRDALLFFDGERYLLHDWVIMPNHVHLLMTTNPDSDLSGILHSLKSFSAKAITKALEVSGKVWQKESFDHIVRNAESFERFRAYIKANPRGLSNGEFLLGIEHSPWSAESL